MGRELYKIKAGLIELVRSVIGDLVLSGEVTAVDEAAYTCDVTTENGMELYGVQLAALKESGKGCVIIPKIGATIQMLNIGDDYLVIAVEEADKVIQVTKKLEIKAEETIYNGGENRGLVKIAALEENLEALKKYVEALKSATSAGIKGVGVSTGANGPVAATAFDGQMASQAINFADMENPKVKH